MTNDKCWCNEDIDHDLNNLELDVYVNSWGGVGTSAFIEWISENNLKVNCRSDKDHIKHLNNPLNKRLEKVKIKKAIFIYDDPINSVISLFKRNYHEAQSKKLNDGKSYISGDWDIYKYWENDQDFFQFQQHYINWLNTTVDYDIMFVKGQSLYKHRYHILKFLDLPLTLKFLGFHKRSSNWFKDESKRTKDGLYNIYGGFCDLVNSNPDIFLKKAKTNEIINLTINNFGKKDPHEN
jgi:hypothetical protein